MSVNIIIEVHNIEKLQAILTRLYAPEPLDPDARRDLANHMQVVLDEITDGGAS